MPDLVAATLRSDPATGCWTDMRIAVGDRVRLTQLNLTGTVVEIRLGLYFVRIDGERWQGAAPLPVEQHELELLG